MSTEEEKVISARTNIGFWIYLMTDCVLFASFFATYAVLKDAIAGGPSGHDIFEAPTALAETLILLTSSFTAGMAFLAVKKKKTALFSIFAALTAALGIAFLTIELSEFSALIAEGHGWQQSAFLSAFFSLVGLHGIHIASGLFWLAVLLVVFIRRGYTAKFSRQFMLFTMFWHFLDLVWIFIFTVVYLLGVA